VKGSDRGVLAGLFQKSLTTNQPQVIRHGDL